MIKHKVQPGDLVRPNFNKFRGPFYKEMIGLVIQIDSYPPRWTSNNTVEPAYYYAVVKWNKIKFKYDTYGKRLIRNMNFDEIVKIKCK